jgi:hypothetical protein
VLLVGDAAINATTNRNRDHDAHRRRCSRAVATAHCARTRAASRFKIAVPRLESTNYIKGGVGGAQAFGVANTLAVETVTRERERSASRIVAMILRPS